MLNEYAPQRNYWWRVKDFDCNPGIELGDCAEHDPPYSERQCRETCLANPECGAFNLPCAASPPALAAAANDRDYEY